MAFSSVSCYKFDISVFPDIFHSFLSTKLFISLNQSFSISFLAFVLSFVFLSLYTSVFVSSAISSIPTNWWYFNTWDMMILYLDHNLLCTFCWLLHINAWHDTFFLWYLSLPLVPYQDQSVILITSTSSMPTMLIVVRTKRMQDQELIFLCICCGSFQINLRKVVYYFALCTYISWYFLGFVIFNLRRLFCNLQPIVKFFLVWQWYFIKCLPTTHLLLRIDASLWHLIGWLIKWMLVTLL